MWNKTGWETFLVSFLIVHSESILTCTSYFFLSFLCVSVYVHALMCMNVDTCTITEEPQVPVLTFHLV